MTRNSLPSRNLFIFICLKTHDSVLLPDSRFHNAFRRLVICRPCVKIVLKGHTQVWLSHNLPVLFKKFYWSSGTWLCHFPMPRSCFVVVTCKAWIWSPEHFDSFLIVMQKRRKEQSVFRVVWQILSTLHYAVTSRTKRSKSWVTETNVHSYDRLLELFLREDKDLICEFTNEQWKEQSVSSSLERKERFCRHKWRELQGKLIFTKGIIRSCQWRQ